MGEIVLVRHGQANTTARDEASYDALSDLGRTQSQFVGAFLRDQGEAFDQVVSGDLNRQRNTAEEMGFVPEIDTRLNEMDYFNLAEALRQHKGVALPGSTDFADHAPKLVAAWHEGEIMGNETFASFETRVASVLKEAATPGRRVLCVTSGGVVSMMLRQLLGLDPVAMANVLLPIYNTSIHRIHVRPHGIYLAGFNAVPHLEDPDRHSMKTHY